MIAMIFAAGKGTRLKPFTDFHPKALAEVGGVPMLELSLRRVIKAGARVVVVNVHHFADQIIDFLHSRTDWGARILVSDERGKLLDTGGGLLNARELLATTDENEPILIHNSDILTDIPLYKIVEQHQRTNALVTLLVAPRNTARHFYFDKRSHRLLFWGDDRNGSYLPYTPENLDSLDKMAFGGVHVVSPSIFPYLELYKQDVAQSDVFSITPFYVDIAHKVNIQSFVPDCAYHWMDIGTGQRLMEANQMAKIFINGNK